MDVFAALADPVRRSLLRSLSSRGPARVVDLASELPISRPAVSKHLRMLTEAGLVSGTVHGRERHYAVLHEGLAEVADLLAELAPAAVHPGLHAHTLDALDTEVRRTGRERRRAEAAPTRHPAHQHEETA